MIEMELNKPYSQIGVSIGQFAGVVGITAEQAAHHHGGLLIRDTVKGTGPKNLTKAQNKARIEVKKSFYPIPRDNFLPSNAKGGDIWGDDKQGEDSETQWLYASPKVLVGAPKAQMKTDLSSDQLVPIHYKLRNRVAQFSVRWRERGKRGKQKVMIVNKPVVRASAFKGVVKTVLGKFGKLKASFAYGWDQLGIKDTLPAWVKKHVQSKDAKGEFINNLKQPDGPEIIVISRQPGCESDKQLRIIRAAVVKRVHAIKSDLKLYFRGIKRPEDFRKQHNFSNN